MEPSLHGAAMNGTSSTARRWARAIGPPSRGDRFGAAITEDGHIVCWGRSDSDQATPRGPGHDNGYPTESGFAKIAVGQYHGLALRDDGTIAVWGLNDMGQAPNPPPAGTFIAVAGTYRGSIALRSSGALHAWGDANVSYGVPAGEYSYLADCMSSNHGLVLRGCYANCDGSTTPPILNVNDRSEERRVGKECRL